MTNERYEPTCHGRQHEAFSIPTTSYRPTALDPVEVPGFHDRPTIAHDQSPLSRSSLTERDTQFQALLYQVPDLRDPSAAVPQNDCNGKDSQVASLARCAKKLLEGYKRRESRQGEVRATLISSIHPSSQK